VKNVLLFCNKYCTCNQLLPPPLSLSPPSQLSFFSFSSLSCSSRQNNNSRVAIVCFLFKKCYLFQFRTFFFFSFFCVLNKFVYLQNSSIVYLSTDKNGRINQCAAVGLVMFNVKPCNVRHFCETQDNEENRILW